MNFRALLAIALLTMSSLAFSETRLPHIVILATGGTIAGSAASNTQTTGYKAGALGVQTLINAVPEMSKIAHVEGEQVANIGSENMTSDIILELSKRVNALLARDDVDGVVITHGTDTLDETPYFLNLTVKSNKPVVFTAAMRPATTPIAAFFDEAAVSPSTTPARFAAAKRSRYAPCCSSSSSCVPSCWPWIFKRLVPNARSCATVMGRPFARQMFLPSA